MKRKVLKKGVKKKRNKIDRIIDRKMWVKKYRGA